MKPDRITKTDFRAIPVSDDWDGLKSEHEGNPFSFHDFTVPESMTQQQVEPPAYMWDRIASVLDAQDRLKAANQIIPTVPQVSAKANGRRIFFYAAVAMVVGALILSVI